ncbi:hypothetical protein CK203_048472 [Vitis vinifera]|uniref:Reverse transcriptase zinc-binding domain-containing protein n=1 Tax=Vitis vinifera TaxID=29760 RepID=A0A438H288_VITVI|nr:hypothetical protein CK203_048472 [Vitis vinifera]
MNEVVVHGLRLVLDLGVWLWGCLYEAGKYNKIQLLDLFCEAVVPCLGNSTASNHHLGSGISSSSDHSIHHQYLISEKCSFICQAIRKLYGEGVQISHLLFADGTLVFCEASQDQMAYLSWLLMWFEAISGFRINLDKRPFYVNGVWCFADKRGALWKQVVNGKYGVKDGGWSIRAVREGMRFWKDKWCRDVLLCVSFPFLYALAVAKEVWVADAWDSSVEDGILVSLGPSMIRRVLWTETKNEKFFVKSLYVALELGGVVPFPRSIIWNPCEPSKGWSLANRCFLCLIDEESIDHILIHCTKARVLWELLFALFGVTWVLPLTVRETLLR